MNVHEALLAVRHDVGAIGKSERNDFHGFMFRGIESVLNRVGPVLLAHGVNVYPEIRSLESRDITTSKGKKEREVTVWVAYHYVGPEGDEVVSVVPGEASNGGSSAVSQAMSVALRISHLQALQIPTAMTDPEAGSLQRAENPLVKVKQDIWAEAEKRGWVDENGGYELLRGDYAQWAQGDQTLDDAEQDDLERYLVHLRPNRKMSRAKPAGAQ